MNIRQIALVANELGPVRDQLFALLGIDGGFNDPGVAEFGLQNVVMRIGSNYLEVVSPVQKGTTAARYLQRRGGDSGYMVLVQVDDLAREKARLNDIKVRIVWEVDLGAASALHLHPGDVPGAISSMDEMRPPSIWYWGGADGGMAIPAARYVDAILAADIESSDPSDTARKWSKAYGREIITRGGMPVLPMDTTEIRFVATATDRAPGLSGVDLRTTDRAAVERQARFLGLAVESNSVHICGTRLRFC